MTLNKADRWSVNKSFSELVLDTIMFKRTKDALELGKQLAAKCPRISLGECETAAQAILILDPFYRSWVHEFADGHGLSDDIAMAVGVVAAIATHVNASEDASSLGERAVTKYLQDRRIKFTAQKSFSDLRHIGLLRFDFFLDDRNIAIEYNGRQHYQPIEYFGGDAAFSDVVLRDHAKEAWCKLNGVNLIVIRYDCCVKSYLDKVLDGLF